MNAQSPYAATKVAADQLALSYHRSFGTPAVILRPFNTFGPRQYARAVLPAILAQLLSGQRQIQLGRLDPRRDLTFVADTVEGFLLAGERPALEGETVQLGTGRSVSVAELFQIGCAELGVKAAAREDPRRLRPGPSEVEVLQSDPSRARERLGWEPRCSLEEGVRRTAEWMEHNLHLYRPEELHV